MAIQAQKYKEGRPAIQAELPNKGRNGKDAGAPASKRTTRAGSAPRAKAAMPAAAVPQPDLAAQAGVRALVLSPTNELAAQSARVLKLLLPGTGVRAALLTNSTAAGTDFTKVALKP